MEPSPSPIVRALQRATRQSATRTASPENAALIPASAREGDTTEQPRLKLRAKNFVLQYKLASPSLTRDHCHEL